MSPKTPTLCGSFLHNKRALVAFTWTLTVMLTLVAFVTSLVLIVHVHTRYRHVERYFEEQSYAYQQEQGNYYNQQEDGDSRDQKHSQDNNQNEYAKKQEEYALLRSISSPSVAFASLYTMTLSLALSIYGSTAIVGFMSLRGDYIAPCFFSPPPSTVVRRRVHHHHVATAAVGGSAVVAGASAAQPVVVGASAVGSASADALTAASGLRVGVFGGAVILFANLLLICAVIFGEVRVRYDLDTWDSSIPFIPICLLIFNAFILCCLSFMLLRKVEDWKERRDNEDSERYEVERIATILAVTCMFLSALYIIFAVLLFLYYGSGSDPDIDDYDDEIDVGGLKYNGFNDDSTSNIPGSIVKPQAISSLTNQGRSASCNVGMSTVDGAKGGISGEGGSARTLSSTIHVGGLTVPGAAVSHSHMMDPRREHFLS
jgi:hypothetical protein